MPNKDPLLSFEEFQEHQNNFYLHFEPEGEDRMFGPIYRGQAPYQQVLAEHGEEFKALARELQEAYEGGTFAPEFQKKLYEAYKIMHPHASSNYDLFK